MPVLATIIILALSFYVFYKIKQVRSTLPAEKNWLSAKSGIALGVFVSFFGINQLFLHQTTITFIIAGVFILLGGLNIWTGIKRYQFYLPHAAQEAEQKLK